MIKKIHFYLTIASIAIATTVSAQCSTDPLYQDSLFGIWPDTNENLPCGRPNEYYETVMQFKLPTEANQVDDTYPPGVLINWIRLDAVSGLPNGISFTTDAASSTPANQWNAGTQGCAVLLGQAAAGTYNVSIDVTGEIGISGVPGTETALSFGGYVLEIFAGCVVGLHKKEKGDLYSVNVVPNPFVGNAKMEFNWAQSEEIDLSVYDALGKEVYHEKIAGNAGANSIDFISGGLPYGIYMYQLSSELHRISGKMIISSEQ